MDMKLAGRKLRSWRRVRHITQIRLAEMTGLSVSCIGQIEKGKENPSMSTLYALCKALGISMDYVAGLTE